MESSVIGKNCREGRKFWKEDHRHTDQPDPSVGIGEGAHEGKLAGAWLGHFRRLAKDVEILTATAENVIRIAMLKITLAK
jgi:hypothetical protein